MPSHDCICTVLARLRLEVFHSGFVKWMRGVAAAIGGENPSVKLHEVGLRPVAALEDVRFQTLMSCSLRTTWPSAPGPSSRIPVIEWTIADFWPIICRSSWA
jgi:hypothetical protein